VRIRPLSIGSPLHRPSMACSVRRRVRHWPRWCASARNKGFSRSVGWPAEYNTLTSSRLAIASGEYVGRAYPCSRAVNRPAPAGANEGVIMSMSQQEILIYENNKKNVFVTYLFWFLLGLFGAHRFYLRDLGRGLLLVGLGFITIICQLMAFGPTPPSPFFGWVVGLVWILLFSVDAFLIPSRISHYNNRLLRETTMVAHDDEGPRRGVSTRGSQAEDGRISPPRLRTPSQATETGRGNDTASESDGPTQSR